jgi:hypothetical protein
MRPLVICGLSLLAATFADLSPILAQERSREIPELAVLDQWRGYVDSKSETPTPRTGSATSVWAVDRRFLRQDWTIDPSDSEPRFSGSTVMTYDPNAKLYRSWTFQSNGEVVESTGPWDAAKRTMTWTSKPTSSGDVVLTEARFAADGSEQWKVTVQDASGTQIFESTGSNTPPKK